MKLNPKEFKRFKELSAKLKAGKCSEEEKAELAALAAKRNERGSNDIAWWKNYPTLLRDVVNVPFNWIPGTRVAITGPSNTTDELHLGVMLKADLRPAIGLSTTDADAFNAQIRQLWLDLHRRYRGIGTYEKSDLGIAILAINSAFETLAKFERIYAVINTYKVGNRTIPQGLKEALGIGLDLEQNLADFRYTLNLNIAKLKQLCLPKGMSVLASDLIALLNIYKDSKNERGFIYMFDTDTFGWYDPSYVNGSGTAIGGAVFYKKFSAGYMSGVTADGRAAFTLFDVNNVLNTVVGALLNDDDIARMCSDLLAAYGPENVMQISDIPENMTIEPVEDYERALQFHNMTVCHNASSIFDDAQFSATDADALSASGYPIVIYQANNTVKCRLGASDDSASHVLVGSLVYPTVDSTVSGKSEVKQTEMIFDTWADDPGETEVMCGTRYSAIAGTRVLVSTNTTRQALVSFGTKVCSKITVYNYANGSSYYTFDVKGNVLDFTDIANTYANFVSFITVTQMDWAPILYISNGSGNIEYFGDIDNFAVINADNLRRIHEVALLSGYKIPMVASHD